MFVPTIEILTKVTRMIILRKIVIQTISMKAKHMVNLTAVSLYNMNPYLPIFINYRYTTVYYTRCTRILITVYFCIVNMFIIRLITTHYYKFTWRENSTCLHIRFRGHPICVYCNYTNTL